MAANLTPEYKKHEQRYHAATTDEERLSALQDMLREIPKHKASEKMQAELKRKISQCRSDITNKPAVKTVDFYHVPKGGAGQVVLAGTPNVGKSNLVAVTTNAPVKVAEYPYTTAMPVPGMWPFEDVQIQLVDTPPMTADNVPGSLMGTIRSGDIILIVVDASGDALEQVETITGILTGRGLELKSVPRTQLDKENQNQRSCLIVATKADLPGAEDNVSVLRELAGDKLEILPVSATTLMGLDRLGRRLWELLAVIRIYTKQPGKPADKEKPYILPTGATLEDLAREIHRDLPEKMQFARVWGEGRFDGSRIQRTEVLHDKDVVEIHE